MGAMTDWSWRAPLARVPTVSVAELGGEGHIVVATFGLCLRAWLKMTTGGESGANVARTRVLEFASAVSLGQLSGFCCLR